MGIAAYNRGTRLLINQIDSDARPREFQDIEDLNALERFPHAETPFGPVQFSSGNSGFWITCPTTGYGFWYSTLRNAVRSWKVTIVSLDLAGGFPVWNAIPCR